jgi:deoxyribodipyrimidine photo-lyase
MTNVARQYKLSLVWLRRDLRLHDQHALSRALAASESIQLIFVFDKSILSALSDPKDLRIEFIWESLREIQERLEQLGGSLIVVHDHAPLAIEDLAAQLGAEAVFCNHDYEPSAIERDQTVAAALASKRIAFHSFKDQAIFEKHEVLTAMEQPFSVFTPYKNAWLKKLNATHLTTHECPLEEGIHALSQALRQKYALPSLESLGFQRSALHALKIRTGSTGGLQLLEDFSNRIGKYDEARNYPAVKGPSYLSVHFRFGTISIRQAARLAIRARDLEIGAEKGASTWLSELIWRDFYFQILYHHPKVVNNAFKPAYDLIAWDRNLQHYQAFCEARTGYPLVDAAMVQLNTTGYMHNRLRMVVASFLTKDLGLDWRWGELHFAKKLIDFDLAANNGGWQWAASSGCDAQPYFRIFNPTTQSEKFDPEGRFIRRYLPQLASLSNKVIHSPWLADADTLAKAGVTLGDNYPRPLVDHASARLDTLARYAVVKT